MSLRLFETAADSEASVVSASGEPQENLDGLVRFADAAAASLRGAGSTVGHKGNHPGIAAALRQAESQMVSLAQEADEFKHTTDAGISGPGGR